MRLRHVEALLAAAVSSHGKGHRVLGRLYVPMLARLLHQDDPERKLAYDRDFKLDPLVFGGDPS